MKPARHFDPVEALARTLCAADYDAHIRGLTDRYHAGIWDDLADEGRQLWLDRARHDLDPAAAHAADDVDPARCGRCVYARMRAEEATR